MEKELIFAIDCDEVLRQLLDKMIAIYNDNFENRKTRDDITEFKVEKSFPEIEAQTGITASQWFFQEHSKELFLDTEAFPHIKEDIAKLREYGKVIILTYQKSYQNKVETLLWLENNGIECDGVCFLKNKTLLRADYLIDDNDWNFVGSAVKHGILIDAPYNKDKSLKEIERNCNCDTIERCASLHEFVEKFVKAHDDIKQAAKRYRGYKEYTLKASVPYDDIVGKRRLFGQPGDKVILDYYMVSGTQPLARISEAESWGDTMCNVNELDNYIAE